MSTKVIKVTNSTIESNKNNVTVTQLRDPKSSLIFRYSTVNRGTGVFYLRVFKDGHDKKVRIGKFPNISAQRAGKAIPNVHLKDDYFNHSELTDMAQLCDWYTERTKNNKQIADKTAKQTVSMIANNIKPYLAHLTINEMNDGLIDKYWFTPIQTKLALTTISSALTTLNAMFTWATSLKMISKNPVPKLSIANFTHKRPKVKVGRLNDSKLKQCLVNINTLAIDTQMLLVLLLLHGTRVGETSKARWNDFDFDNLLWRIHAGDTKNKKPHVLPLSPLAVEWLKAYKRYQYQNKRSKYLFPQLKNKRKPRTPSSASRIISKVGNKQWTAHDIRKYNRSRWLENGVDHMIGEFLLNHSLSKLDQSYIQTTAMKLCREALVQWSESMQHLGLTKPSFNTTKKR